MADGPVIVDIPTKPDEFRAAVEFLKRNTETYVEMADVMARIRRAHFLAYRAEGFTDAEALQLCLKVTL